MKYKLSVAFRLSTGDVCCFEGFIHGAVPRKGEWLVIAEEYNTSVHDVRHNIFSNDSESTCEVLALPIACEFTDTDDLELILEGSVFKLTEVRKNEGSKERTSEEDE